MKHLTEEELVERYFGQRGPATENHLEDCAACALVYAAVEKDLEKMHGISAPEPDANYGERMWARVEASLPPRPVREKSSRIGLWRGLAYAAGCAVLAAGAFYAGTVWDRAHRPPENQARNGPAAPHVQPQPKVVVVVLGDHLDRSERLLVELKHADPDSPELVNPMRDEARGLLAANSVFRDDAKNAGDPELSEALDHLEELLKGIATQPNGLNAASIASLQRQMEDDGVLFQVRVLRSKDPHRSKSVRVVARGGAA